MALPAEVWARIFHLAADDDILFRPGIPTSLAESAWCKDQWQSCRDGGGSGVEWNLRSPERAMDILQRRSYSTKKVLPAGSRFDYSHIDMSIIRQSSLPVGSGDRLVSNPSFDVYISAMSRRLSHYVLLLTRLLRTLLLQLLHMAGGRKGYTLVLTPPLVVNLYLSKNTSKT